jgi:hypothetical protein
MKRWPTEPVAPSTPAIESANYDVTASGYIPHFFLGNAAFLEVKCSASIFFGKCTISESIADLELYDAGVG